MKKNNKAYSVVIALGITGFLMMLVVGIFNLVLKEFNDTIAGGNYYKAYYGAEAAQELALLKIKKYGYGVDDKIELSKNDSNSIILSKNPEDSNLFNPNKDVLISYSLNTKTNSYTGKLDSLGYNIIPLFYIDTDSNEHKITDLDLIINNGASDDFVWNILSQTGGISGTGPFKGVDFIVEKEIIDSFIYESTISIESFLEDNTTNYLILFNTGENYDDKIEYNLKSMEEEYFSKPKTNIISSAKIGDYKQNFRTFIDNTEYLDSLKYSIFSN